MEVQRYLRRFSDPQEALSSLSEEHGIKYSTKDELVILNYDMINSNYSEIESECRQLILDISDNFNIVSRSFSRFFNHGESHAVSIDWNSANATVKEDGSICTVFSHRDNWRIATRKTIDATGELGVYGTFAEHIWKLIPDTSIFKNPDYCYVFEFCSPKNRIVHPYEQDELVLLTIFDKIKNIELSWDEVTMVNLNFRRPKRYPVSSLVEVIKMAEEVGDLDEGFCVVDKFFQRIKVKNLRYLQLHHSFARGGILSTDRLFDLAIDMDRAEVISYFSDLGEKLKEVDEFLNMFAASANGMWEEYSNLNIKDFAEKVKDSWTSTFLFYKYRKNREANVNEWLKAPENRRLLVKWWKA